MNQDDNPFQTKSLPSAHEAFGSNLNDDDDSDMPFRNYQKPIFFILFSTSCSFIWYSNNSDL
jgi:hypothetical protein